MQLKNLEYPEKTYSSQAKCLSRSPYVGRFSLRLCRWNTYQPNVAECLDKTLESLQTDYLDLYLIHWPVSAISKSM
jgi:aryl-alcohol dehydrogenase-like predicted oxidoreductase